MAFTDWILWIPVSQPQKVLKMNDKSSIEPTSELSQILKMLESVVELVVARHTLGMPVPAVAPASAVPAAVKPSFHIRTKPEHINWAVIGGAKFTNPPSELFLSALQQAWSASQPLKMVGVASDDDTCAVDTDVPHRRSQGATTALQRMRRPCNQRTPGVNPNQRLYGYAITTPRGAVVLHR